MILWYVITFEVRRCTHLQKSFTSYSPTFALYEISSVPFKNSFCLLTALSYFKLLIVYTYLSEASIIVSPDR